MDSETLKSHPFPWLGAPWICLLWISLGAGGCSLLVGDYSSDSFENVVQDGDVENEDSPWEAEVGESASTENAVQNGGFENGDFPWAVDVGEGASANFTVVKEGSNSLGYLKIDAANFTTGYVFFYQPPISSPDNLYFSIVKDGFYILSFRAKASIDRNMSVGIYRHESPYDCLIIESQVLLTTQWKPYSLILKGVDTAAEEGELIFNCVIDKTEGDIYFDDISLRAS